jgi:molybdenum cofactor biosynthesis protein B
MPADDHQRQAEDTPVRAAVVTVSDTRTEESDDSGRLIRTQLMAENVEVADYEIVPDEEDAIAGVIDELAGTVDVVILNGGTGISARDRTPEILGDRLEKTLPGFGEIFRMLSYEEVGAAAMLSRATAGVYDATLFFATPGSPNAVELALEKLILPQLKHLVWEIVRQLDD